MWISWPLWKGSEWEICFEALATQFSMAWSTPIPPKNRLENLPEANRQPETWTNWPLTAFGKVSIICVYMYLDPPRVSNFSPPGLLFGRWLRGLNFQTFGGFRYIILHIYNSFDYIIIRPKFPLKSSRINSTQQTPSLWPPLPSTYDPNHWGTTLLLMNGKYIVPNTIK